MDLAPITSRRLVGRTQKFGTELSVTDPAREMVVRAAVGKAAGTAYAVIYTAGGTWRIRKSARNELTGTESSPVLDLADKTVATLVAGEVALAGGETLPWKLTGVLRKRCRLGGDLWEARRRGGRDAGFRADLSAAMLAREDVALLAGLFSVLTHSVFAGGSSGGGWAPIDLPGVDLPGI